jgi:hypothetical protein
MSPLLAGGLVGDRVVGRRRWSRFYRTVVGLPPGKARLRRQMGAGVRERLVVPPTADPSAFAHGAEVEEERVPRPAGARPWYLA